MTLNCGYFDNEMFQKKRMKLGHFSTKKNVHEFFYMSKLSFKMDDSYVFSINRKVFYDDKTLYPKRIKFFLTNELVLILIISNIL